jgi:DNA polymerase III alpha subunit
MASVLSNHGGYYSSAVYINECKRMGLNVLLPSINHSDSEYEGHGDTIQIGLLAIKEIQTHTVEKIIEERKANGCYVSLIDFLVRTKTSYEQTKLLIKCGAMDCLDKTRPTLMRLIDIYFRQKEKWDESYNNLFFNESLQLEKEVETGKEYGIEKICTIEYELLGYMVTKHPLEFFRGITDSPKIVKAIDLQNHSGKKIKMIGWFMASKRIKTKKGDIMKFLSLEDLSGTFEAVIFPGTYAKYAELTLSMGPYLIEGKADIENGNNIIVEKMIVLSAAEIKSLNQKESTGNKYFGDVEKISEEEFTLVKSLGKEKLRRAYL